jgi:hypothetical protein
MNRTTPDNARGTGNRSRGALARVRGLVQGLACFAAGMALSAWWFLRAPPPGPAAPESAGPPALSDATKADSAAAFVPRADPAAVDAVKRLVPNVDSVSAAEGAEVLRQSSFAEFQQAVQTMQARVKEAEARFLQAQADQSEAGQEAARKEIQQIQAEHLAGLRRLTATSQAQINALQQIKGAAH